MRKLLVALYFCVRCYAALDSTTAGDVRPTGNDLNGGNFASGIGSCGTDYSVQDTPHVTFDGATITASNGGAGATITLSGYTVATTDKCNGLKVASGTNFVVSYFQIISVNVGANTWTLDRNITTGAGSGLVGRMGGGLLTIAQGLTMMGTGTANSVCQAACPGTLWLQKNPYTQTVVLNQTQGIYVHGYKTAHGDLDSTTATVDNPLITTATNSTTLWNINWTGLATGAWANGVVFIHVNFSNTAATRAPGICPVFNASALAMFYGKMDGFTWFVNGNATTCGYFHDLHLYGMEIVNGQNTGAGSADVLNDQGAALVNISYSNFHGSNAETALKIGLSNIVGVSITYSIFTGYSLATSDCLFLRNNGGDKSSVIDHNVFYGCGRDGLRLDGGAQISNVSNNVAYGNTGIGFNTINPAGFTYSACNAAGGNTGGASANLVTNLFPVTLTADPFVSPTNFQPNNTPGGGPLLKNVSCNFIGALAASGGASNSASVQ